MFYRHLGVFKPASPGYLPLSRGVSDHGSHPKAESEIETQQSSGKTNNNYRLSASNKWLSFTPICVLALGLVVGSILGAWSSEYLQAFGTDVWLPPKTGSKQFAPEMSTMTVVFSRDEELMALPGEVSQRAWDALIPIGHGFVNVSNPAKYGLRPGISTESGVDRYSVAMFHQLHCLATLRHNYFRLIDAMAEDWTDVARQSERDDQLRDRHAQHCFTYIAESIWCSGDLTIEWAKIERDGRRKQVDGWDIPHQCKDPEAIREWMEVNHGPSKDGHYHIHD